MISRPEATEAIAGQHFEVVVIGDSLSGLMEAPLRVRRATLDAPLEERHDWTATE